VVRAPHCPPAHRTGSADPAEPRLAALRAAPVFDLGLGRAGPDLSGWTGRAVRRPTVSPRAARRRARR